MTVKVRDYPVIRKNIELIVRKKHSQKPIVIFFTGMGLIILPEFSPYTCCASAAVMTVRYIGRGKG